jgi:FKBP-type peptidyl-prolyl cis-trans isomerase FklB
MRYVLFSLLCLGFLATDSLAEEKAVFKDPEDAVSYAVGFRMGAEYRKYDIPLNPEMIAAGFRDAMSGTQPKPSEEEMKGKLSDLEARIKKAQQEELKEQAAKNLAESDVFLAENGKKDGVVTLPSGLQYQVLKKGEGPSPKATDTVTVHYLGTFIDGKEFDSSYKRGQPATFRLDRVIKGWTEGVQLMKPGAKWKLFIPPKLAYGERASRIPPNSTLIFEVELISVVPVKVGDPGKGGKGENR